MLVTALVVADPLPGLAAMRDGTIEYFDGGALRSNAMLSLGFLYGAGARPDGLGAPISTVHSGIGAVSANPAGLAYIGGGGLMIDALPPIGISVTDIANLEERAARAIDDALEDVAAYGMRPNYPELDAQVGQQAELVSGAIAVRVGRVVLGASIDEPVVLELKLVENGIEAFAGGVKNDGGSEVDIDMRGFADAACDLAFRVERTTAALAADVGNGVGLGVSVSRYSARASVSGILRGDGIVNYGGQEYSFNDDADPWENELGGSLDGSYDGYGLGWTVGASYRGLAWVTLGAVYSRQPELSLEGRLVSVESMPPAVTDDGVDVDLVTASQPTLTETEVTIEDDNVTLRLPSYAGIAATFDVVGVSATLEYRMYSGNIGFEHQDYSEGVALSHGLGLELWYKGLRVGGGVITGKLVGNSAADANSDNVLIPLANLGMGFELGEHAGVDLLVLAIPLQVARLSFTYEF